jgi:phosphoglycerate kinase
VEKAAAGLQVGDVLLLENLRFHKEETDNDPHFSEMLARLGEVYVNDAFGSAHRAHSSTEGVAKYFKLAVSGFLMEKELNFLGSALVEPKRPFVALLGGAKISDKIPVIEQLIDRVDRLLIGGGMAYTFLKVQGKEVGQSIVDETSLDFVRSILRDRSDKIVLPIDCVTTDQFDFKQRLIGHVDVVSVDGINPGWMGLDIGPDTVDRFRTVCLNAGTIVWNGPMGVFEIEETAKGTLDIAQCLAEATRKGTVTIIGGGDSASAVKKAGVAEMVSHVSTGGGASLEFLQGKTLPGVAVLTDTP